MSLIEREKLIDHLNACLAESDGGTPITDAMIVAIRCAVEQMPEVDAVPVVRCEDCKNADVAYCRDHKTISRTEIYCIKDENRHGKQWYCADGEWRADNEAV